MGEVTGRMLRAREDAEQMLRHSLVHQDPGPLAAAFERLYQEIDELRAVAMAATNPAALAEAEERGRLQVELCSLCHCCGERRHDGGDPCVSCAEAEERGRRGRDSEVASLRSLLLTRVEASRLDEANAEIASLRAKLKEMEEHAECVRLERDFMSECTIPDVEATAESRGFHRGLEAAADEVELCCGGCAARIRQIKETP